jgi:hypothetical protein
MIIRKCSKNIEKQIARALIEPFWRPPDRLVLQNQEGHPEPTW